MKFESDFSSAKTLQLTSAILLYTGGTDTLATIHTVEQTETGARIGPGKVPSAAALQRMAAELFSAKGIQYLPANVLAYTNARIVWHQPSCLRRIWFGKDVKSDRLQALNGKVVRWPALLFSAANRGLNVHGLATDERPIPTTPLYRAPFPNVTPEGGVALCSARPPSHAGLDTMTGFERSFYDTQFTHSEGTGTVHGDYTSLWESMAKKPKAFPVAALKDNKITLESYLK